MSISTTLVNKPSLIEWGPLRFLIMDHPKPSNLHLYLKECKKNNVSNIVRISQEAEQYSAEEVENAGIHLTELFYDDGTSPPAQIIAGWLELISNTFDRVKKGDPIPCIAVHCIAGLGRAPVLVAIALIEYGCDAMFAVTMIRERRRGAINKVQLHYLQSYTPSRRGKGGKYVPFSWLLIYQHIKSSSNFRLTHLHNFEMTTNTSLPNSNDFSLIANSCSCLSMVDRFLKMFKLKSGKVFKFFNNK
eukprot:gene5706-7875_t